MKQWRVRFNRVDTSYEVVVWALSQSNAEEIAALKFLTEEQKFEVEIGECYENQPKETSSNG